MSRIPTWQPIDSADNTSGKAPSAPSPHPAHLQLRQCCEHFFPRRRFQIRLPVVEVHDVLNELLRDVEALHQEDVDAAECADVRLIEDDPRVGPAADRVEFRSGLPFGLKQRSREFRLSNDAQQGAASQRVVKRNRNGYRRGLQTLLHDPMAASLTDLCESVLLQNPANLRARKNSKPTQPAPQPGSRELRCESDA
jgi:hypothetical protein